MKIQKLSKRSYLLVILVLPLPVLFIIYSPVIMASGVYNGIITFSAIVFGVMVHFIPVLEEWPLVVILVHMGHYKRYVGIKF